MLAVLRFKSGMRLWEGGGRTRQAASTFKLLRNSVHRFDGTESHPFGVVVRSSSGVAGGYNNKAKNQCVASYYCCVGDKAHSNPYLSWYLLCKQLCCGRCWAGQYSERLVRLQDAW